MANKCTYCEKPATFYTGGDLLCDEHGIQSKIELAKDMGQSPNVIKAIRLDSVTDVYKMVIDQSPERWRDALIAELLA